MTAVTAKEARRICDRLGLSFDDAQHTFWAYDEESDEIYDFDHKNERDAFVQAGGVTWKTKQHTSR